MLNRRKVIVLLFSLVVLVVSLATPVRALGGAGCFCSYIGPDGNWHATPIPVQDSSLANCKLKCLEGWRIGSPYQTTCNESPIGGGVCSGSSTISSQAEDTCSTYIAVQCGPN